MNPLRSLKLKIRNSDLVGSAIYKRQEHPLKKLRLVRPGDDAVVDGFPRSANTYATFAFLLSQPERPTIGNHLHNPLQFHRARKYGVPSMLVLREPRAACLSYMVLANWSDPMKVIDRYIAFHAGLPDEEAAFVVAPFEEVTTDFGASIDRLNEQFGTAFARFEHTPANEKMVKQAILDAREARLAHFGDEFHDEFGLTLPSEAKSERRAEFEARFEDAGVSAALDKARGLYDRLLARAQ